MFTRPKNDQEIIAMRNSGKILATILQTVKHATQAGMSTFDMADIAAKELKALGGEPVFLNYSIGSHIPPFPSVICISLNDEVVHGIPKKSKLIQKGDIVSIDFGVKYNGMVTDAAITFAVGEVSTRENQLITATEESLLAGIQVLSDGVRVGDISYAVEKVLKRAQLGIVRDLVGHGVGHTLHEEPDIPNYGFSGSGPLLRAGMTIAIEPMATLGTHKVDVTDDQWTIVTHDGSLSAHFEHTVLILDKGYEILTTL